jgi:DNA replication protein DnaC
LQKLPVTLAFPSLPSTKKYIKTGRPFEENLLELLKEQAILADNNRIQRRIRYSGFPIVKTLDTFEVTPERFPHLNINEFNELSSCHFIDEKADVVALGPAGHGKTHSALALGYEAIIHVYSVRFKRAFDLVNEMSEAKSEKKLENYKKTLNRCQLLIIDEVGYLPFDSAASSLLFQIISARYETASTIYTTNHAFSKWPQFMKNADAVAAMVDKIAHNAIVLNMNGPKSWRLEHARSRIDELLNNNE